LVASPERITDEANHDAIQLLEAAEDHLNHHHPKHLERAVQLYRECIAKSVAPWGLPYLPVAEAYINLGHVGFCRLRPSKAFAEARQAVKTAHEIDPTLPDIRAHSALLCMFEWKWDEVVKHF